MSAASLPRRVLVIEDEPSIRNTLYILLAALNCQSDVAYSGQQALAMIARESFDAVLLDVRCSDLPAEQMLSRINQLRPNLVGRVLFISGEVSDPQTLAMIERSAAPQPSRGRFVEELWQRLRAVLSEVRTPRRA